MITIYGDVWCESTCQAIEHCVELEVTFRFIPAKHYNPACELFESKGWQDTPQIFIEDEHIGGCTQLLEVYPKED